MALPLNAVVGPTPYQASSASSPCPSTARAPSPLHFRNPQSLSCPDRNLPGVSAALPRALERRHGAPVGEHRLSRVDSYLGQIPFHPACDAIPHGEANDFACGLDFPAAGADPGKRTWFTPGDWAESIPVIPLGQCSPRLAPKAPGVVPRRDGLQCSDAETKLIVGSH